MKHGPYSTANGKKIFQGFYTVLYPWPSCALTIGDALRPMFHEVLSRAGPDFEAMENLNTLYSTLLIMEDKSTNITRD
ncbi:unnamed protein product [Arabidopsis thaliana]|uniref:Uncharacterized protein n=1 Tax=Arabidopsis thaliana TaxID=3702 RepID=A0A5S9XDA2_ARATH|nr:unnamed protein product [Arabidopsis thaliana]